jgi:ribose 5-phosphate isomerase B
MKVGVGADHGGFEMKEQLAKLLAAEGHEVVDFGDKIYGNNDDYPDFAMPPRPGCRRRNSGTWHSDLR